MKQYIIFIHVLLFYLTKSEGSAIQSDEDSSSDYHLPGKAILSNLIRQQNRPVYLQKYKAAELKGEGDEANILNIFLNRFQPALDRETKRLVDKVPGQHPITDQGDAPEYSRHQIPDSMGYPFLRWRDTRAGKKMKRDAMTQVCTRVPGKVMCKFGRFTYVINTKDRDLDSDELEKLVSMIHQRVSDGDKTFDLSLIAPEAKVGVARESSEALGSVEEGGGGGSWTDESLMLVECTPSLDNANTPEGFRQTKYYCTTTSLKLKRDLNEKDMSKLKQDDKAMIIATPVAKTCSTQMFVRKFSDVCTPPICWCPETTIKPCSSTYLPKCIPWCNPFLKEPNAKQKLAKTN